MSAQDVNPGLNKSPANKYKTSKEKYMDHCRNGLKIGTQTKANDVYNLQNYRQDNPKLKVELPGEKMRLFL